VLRALVIYLGVLCFTTTIKRFDVVLATTITTVRKVVTILLSFLVFPKPFSSMYVFGVIAFSIGLYINFYQEKNRPRPAPTTK
jgi:adenosine 3'-phospho 5'-phosphosulfate transporter B3